MIYPAAKMPDEPERLTDGSDNPYFQIRVFA